MSVAKGEGLLPMSIWVWVLASEIQCKRCGILSLGNQVWKQQEKLRQVDDFFWLVLVLGRWLTTGTAFGL